MADLISDGMTRVTWCPAVANVHAPTLAELTAGTDLETFITPDGLGITPETAMVDTSSLASTFDTGVVGRRSYKNELKCKRSLNTADDIAFNLLVYGTVGFLVVRRNRPRTDAWTAGDQVETYPSQCGEPALAPPAPNEVQKFTSMIAVTSEPDTRAVVAA